MKILKQIIIVSPTLLLFFSLAGFAQTDSKESRSAYESRMQWWDQARFGLFIHWGLYAIPAGEWNGETNHAEWIRTTAQIPLEEYDRFLERFNPQSFNADEWVNMAVEAGMKYIVITSKHHDGFCLFDSKFTDFDVMSTPFKRDILKELSDACRKKGIKLCFYYSIMDWHYPDYLPRRDWEKDRPVDKAEFERYVEYMKNQVRELVTNYGDLGVLWFDGNLEQSWSNQRGKEMYSYVRSFQPMIIVNDRVGQQSGYTFTEQDIVGDFRSPEQLIPATGIPGIFWETCMTMNDHWGYNSRDANWKSTKELIRQLADIASKGGNFLLNVGPTAEGLFPNESVTRLKEIGKWMEVNGEAIYGTTASPFHRLPWGRCTKKIINGDTKLYLHVFNYPDDGKLVLPGIANTFNQAYLLSNREQQLAISREEDALIIQLPVQSPDTMNTVVALDIKGEPDVVAPPVISAPYSIFIDETEITIQVAGEKGETRYTIDGSTPTIHSPLVSGSIVLTGTTTVSARWFRDGKPLSETSRLTFTKVIPRPARKGDELTEGIQYKYYEGDWDIVPDFSQEKPVKEGTLPNVNFSPRNREEYFAFEFSCYLKIDETAVYSLFTNSDDGSRLYIGDSLIVDNDQLHPMQEKEGVIALSAGLHPIRIAYFEKTGGDNLIVSIKSIKKKKQVISNDMVFIDKQQ